MGNRRDENKKLKLLMLTDGNSDQASARIRAIQYIPMLEEAGYSVSFIPRVPLKIANPLLKYTYFPFMKRILWVKRYFALYFQNWDVIYIQRLFINESALIKITRKSRLIFDFDDAIYLNNKNKTANNKAANMVRYADQVIVSTPWLNDFCLSSGKNATVIPTPVETDIIKPSLKKSGKRLVIGWIGSSWTTNYLNVVEPVLQQLSKEIDFEFLTVGAKPGYSIVGVNHKNMPWKSGIEAEALTKIDIGIMPLPDEDYARAKGGYKLYLYMAAGIPCVASPVGVNTSIIKNGESGFLAASVDEWLDALKLLLHESVLRQSMGQVGRQQAIDLYDRKVCFSQLSERIKNSNIDE
jgi:glycosyltransferase involved in cell wall biosynthesis